MDCDRAGRWGLVRALLLVVVVALEVIILSALRVVREHDVGGEAGDDAGRHAV